MKQRSLLSRLGAAALGLTLLTTCLLGGTLAKFVSRVPGSAEGTIAAWNFEVNGSNTGFTTIDLGRDSYTDATVANGVIAPGTSGAFIIELDGNGSEVGIDYDIVIKAAEGVNVPNDLTFTIDDKTYALGQLIEGTIDCGADMTEDILVNWSWDYGPNDSIDYNDNEYASTNLTLDIAVIGTQVMPELTTAG